MDSRADAPGSQQHDRRVTFAIAVIWLLFAAAVYLRDVGRGFVKDDFRWILDGTIAFEHPLRAFSAGWEGNFYRPLVALSFGLDRALYGLWARGYGLTNLALYAGCAAMVFVLLRQIRFGLVAAAAGAFAWAVNPSGIDMAVLWISGRTSLLMTLFSCASIVAMLRGHRALGCALFAAAIFSKEDALPIPAVIATAKLLDGRPRREWLIDLACMGAVAAAYFGLRAETQAFTAGSAPDFYRLTWSPARILENLLHYVDRAATSTLVLIVLLGLFYRRVPPLGALARRDLLLALAFFLAGVCITVRVPIRSSLYVVFASIAAGIVFAAIVERMRQVGPLRDDRWLVTTLGVVLLMIPVYGVRNDRWVEPARVSARTLAALRQVPELTTARRVVFYDEAVRHSNFDSAFGGAEQPALQLFTGRVFDAHVVPPGAPPDPSADISVRLERGAVRIDTRRQTP